MTLEEKLNEQLGYDANSLVPIELEKIADNYAIEFAEWITENAYKESKCWRMYDKKDNEYSTEQLLEIFKKEKGL